MSTGQVGVWVGVSGKNGTGFVHVDWRARVYGNCAQVPASVCVCVLVGFLCSVCLYVFNECKCVCVCVCVCV